MKIFKDYTFTWWQMGILKATVFSLGLALGAYANVLVRPYVNLLIIVSIVCGVYLASITLGKDR